jgi:hypothetical protein
MLLSLSIASSGTAIAQTEAADLAQGIRQVDEGDLPAAIITLDGVVKKLIGVPGRTTELSMAHLYLGMANLGLNQAERARLNFREAWLNNKGLKLDSKKFPPRVIQAFEEAKSEAVSAPRAAAAPSGSPSAGEPVAPAKKGGGKGLLIIGGVALVGGAVAVAGGGGSGGSSPNPTPAPTVAPGPQVLLQTTWQLVGSGSTQSFPISVPAAGTLTATVDWTLATDDVDLFLLGPTGALITSAESATSKPERISTPVSAGTHTVRVLFYGLTNGDLTTGRESGTVQVVFTRQ